MAGRESRGRAGDDARTAGRVPPARRGRAAEGPRRGHGAHPPDGRRVTVARTTDMPRTSMHSDAWLLRGGSSIPGRLLLEHGHIRFVVSSSGTAWPWQVRRLARQRATTWPGDGAGRARDAELFRWPLDGVRAWAPRYYFSGGIRLAHAGRVLRFSFGRPVDAEARGEELDVYREV